MRYLAWCVCAALLVGMLGVAPVQAAGDQQARIAGLTRVCVDSDDHRVRRAAGSCGRGESAIELSIADRARFCDVPGSPLLAVGAAACGRRGGRAFRVPSNRAEVFCANRRRAGLLRSVGRVAACRTYEYPLRVRNSAPGTATLSRTTVTENVPVGSEVGRLTALDPDRGDRLSFRLVPGPGDDDNAAFSVDDGSLRTGAPVDFESQPSYRLRVRATDLLGRSREARLQLTVVDVDENRQPTGVGLAPARVAENQPTGTLVGTLSTDDPDAGDAHGYTLVGGADAASFTIAGDQLRTATPLDFEAGATREIRVRSDDGRGGAVEQALSISVTDADDAPSGVGLSSNTVPENTTDAVVGTLGTEDQDAGDSHGFQLVSGAGDADNGSFRIAGDQLLTAVALDFEVRSTYSLRVRVTDAAGLRDEAVLQVVATDANDAPTAVTLSPASVAENEPAGTVVGPLAVVDQDLGDGHALALVADPDSTDDDAFEIVGAELRTTRVLDYEAQQAYKIRVRATDVRGETVETPLTVTVTNLNEPPTGLDLGDTVVDEEQPAGTPVGTLTSQDPDAGDGHLYTLVPGTGDADNASFAIDGDRLVTAERFDFETRSSYSVRIRSTDPGSAMVERQFTIAVGDVNEAPTALTLGADTVAENQPAGTVVGTVTGTDPDAGDRLAYALVGGGDADSFAVDPDTGALTTAATFDFEDRDTYLVTVRVTDAGTPGLSREAEVTVHVVDVNEAPAQLQLAPSDLPENADPGTAVGRLSVTDPDAGQTSSYELVSGTGSTDNGLFGVVGDQLVALDPFDHEVRDTYSVRVRATDSGTPALQVEAALTIEVTDRNDAPTAIALSQTHVAESASVGTAVGTLTTVDQDAGDGHTYSLVGGADDGSFAIVGSELRTAVALDHETRPTLSVRIQTDDGHGGTLQQAFTVTVDDVNEAPTRIDLSGSVVPENVATYDVGTLSAADVDDPAPTDFALVAGEGDTDNASFAVAGGTLSATTAFDFEGGPTLRSVRVRVTDARGASYEQALTVTVINGNDAPTAVALSSADVAENAAAGAVVGSLSSMDQDAGDSHSYALVAGTGDGDNSSFALTSEGALTTAASFDYEAGATKSIRVRSEDPDGAFVEQALTVTVTNVNESPSALDLGSTTVAEAQDAGAVVGSLTSTDPDATDTATYSLVAGDGADDNGLFTIVGDQLCTTGPLDYETASSLSVRIRVSDGDGLHVERVFTIAVTAVNEAPTDLVLSASSVPENSSDATVGSLSATDVDGTDPYTFTLVAGEGSTDNAHFDIQGGALVAVDPFDFETEPTTRQVRVRVTDAGGAWLEKVLDVTVTEANDAPTGIGPADLAVPENLAAGTPVGTLTVTDQDALDTHTFTLVSGTGDTDNGIFNLAGTGLLTTTVPLDREARSSYSIRVETSDGTATYAQPLTVSVDDVNEAPTALDLSASTVAENAAAGTVVGTLTSQDPDAGDTAGYALVSEGADNARFEIVGDELRTAEPLDHETQPSLSVLVRVTDSGGLRFEKTLPITVQDVNEAPTGLALSSTTVPENAAGAVVGDFVPADADGTAPYTYALVTGTGDTDNVHFSVSSGQLVAEDPFDFESGPDTRSVRVQVTDAGGLSYTQPLTVAVTDTNDAPTGVALTTSVVSEDVAVGTEVGTLTSQDQDSGDSHTYALLDDAAGAFALSSAGVLTTAAALDYEAAPAPTIRVRTSDEAGASYEQDVTVAVADVNEPPTALSLSNASVTENQPAGTLVGTLSTDDPDLSDTLTYELVSGTGADDNASFQVTDDRLETADMLDAAASVGGLHVLVRATDAAGHSVEQAFTITVDLENRAPTGMTLADHSVDENAPVGTLVGTLGWTDPDAGDTPSYSLVTGTGGDDNAQFALDAATGELTTAAIFDFETTPSYSIRVRVTDAGGLWFEQPLTVDVADVNEAPIATDDSLTGAVGNTLAKAGTISVTGPVTGLTGDLPLVNDTDPDDDTITAVPASSAATTKGGAVTIQADGSFTYLPPVGVKDTTDTFDYEVTDGTLRDTGTVTVTIANRLVWYVDAAATGTPDGRSTSPYSSLTTLDGAAGAGDPDGQGDEIFLRSGTYNAGIALETDQTLLGEGVALPGILPKGTRPTISHFGSGDVLSLANGSSVDGLNVFGDSLLSAEAVTTAQVGSAVTLTGAGSNPIVKISGSASGAITIAATVSSQGSGNAIEVRDRTGGTVSFTGAIATRRGTAPEGTGGIVLASNTGATVSFSGGLQLTTDTNNAFSATGGGTVTVTGSANTLATTTGTPLRVSGVTIGDAGLTFRSVSTTGGQNGIVVANTGTQGSLSVTGNSTGACGGVTSAVGAVTTAAVAGDCTGGTLSGTTGPAVLLSNTAAPSLTRVRIVGSGDDGIRATGVSGGLTLANSLVENNGNASGEHGLDLGDSSATSPQGVTGTAEITGSTIRGSGADNLVLRNSSGTATLVVSGSQLASPGTSLNGGNIIVESIGSAAAIGHTITANNITGSKDADQIGIRSRAVGTTGGVGGTISSALIQDNTISGATGTVGGGIRIVGDETQGNLNNPYTWGGSVRFDIDGNIMSGALGDAVRLVEMKSQAGASFSGYVRGNTIGTSGGYRSCAGGATGTGLPIAGTGIRADNEGAGAMTLAVTGNNLFRCYELGVGLHVGHGTATLDATVTGNSISMTDAADGQPDAGIFADTGLGDLVSGQSCLDIQGNDIPEGPSGWTYYSAISVLESGTPLTLAGFGGGDETAATAYLQAKNFPATAFAGIGDNGGFQGGTCATPN